MIGKLFTKQAMSVAQTAKYTYSKAPVRVAITGAAGNIGYALVFRIASGQMLGADQPVILQLIDVPQAVNALKGVAMEVNDCAFPLVQDIVCTADQSVGFKDTDYALLVGAKPRGPGMERGDLLKDNGKIFIDTGKALGDNASRDCKIIVVGNPANTNALICANHATGIPKENFTAMTRLDHNRGISQLAEKTGAQVSEISNFGIWGNHSPTMVPDIQNTIIRGQRATEILDQQWVDTFFNPKVQKRGAEIIEARKLSSAASAANAAIEHIRDWVLGSDGWTSMGVPSEGNPYGVPEGLVFSFPVTAGNGSYQLVTGLQNNEYYQQKIQATTKELLEERQAVEHLLR